MNIQIVCTGTELLLGHTLNSNLQFLGRTLDGDGYAVAREVCVPDGGEAIAGAVREALVQADLVITVGGLGPTSDDLTRDAVARELGVDLQFDPKVHEAILAYLGGRTVKVPPEALRVQAMVPAGAEPLLNRNGTAPGLWCHAPGGKIVVMLPGPPSELQPMFQHDVLPRIRTLAPPTVARRSLTVCGIPESAAADRVEALLRDSFPGLEPAYCARPHQVDIRLSAGAADQPRLEEAMRRLAREFGPAALPPGTSDLPTALGTLLLAHNLWLAVAESCTGGWIGKTITDIPGSSAWFCGGVVSYSNDWKQGLLDVPEHLLEKAGAVSAECVGAMLEALFQRYEADAGIAVTGIAGPGGGTAEKPTGLVYIATGVRAQRQIERFLFPGDRDGVRQRAVTAALDQLRRQLLREFHEP